MCFEHSILMVLANHWPRPFEKSPGLLEHAYLEFVARGTDGVTLFFAISGFVITRAIMARNPNIYTMSLYDFYSRRVARIWPLLFFCIAIGAVALALGSKNSVFHANKALPFDSIFWLSFSPSPSTGFGWPMVRLTELAVGDYTGT